MFPVLGTLSEGLTTAGRFIRAYPLMTLAFVGVGAASAALAGSGLVKLPLPVWLAGQITTWIIGAAAILVLAPVWTAMLRFSVLDDTARRYAEFDIRTRRVAVVMVVLSVIGLLGTIPFALGLDVLGRMPMRRIVALGAVAFAFLVRLGAWWLNARLVIAPAMAASGTRPQAFDIAFGYTKGAVPRIWLTLFLVYLPLFAILAANALLERLIAPLPGTDAARVLGTGSVVLAAIASIAGDLLWGATTGRMAVALVRAQRKRAAKAARRAREGGVDDED